VTQLHQYLLTHSSTTHLHHSVWSRQCWLTLGWGWGLGWVWCFCHWLRMNMNKK